MMQVIKYKLEEGSLEHEVLRTKYFSSCFQLIVNEVLLKTKITVIKRRVNL